MSKISEMIQRLPHIWKGDVNKVVIDNYAALATETVAGLVRVNNEQLDVDASGAIHYDHNKNSSPAYVISKPSISSTLIYQKIDKTATISVDAVSLLTTKQAVKVHAVVNEYGVVAESAVSTDTTHNVTFTFGSIIKYEKVIAIVLTAIDTLGNMSESVTVNMTVRPQVITPTILSPSDNSSVYADQVTVVGSDFSVIATIGAQTFDSSDVLVTDTSDVQLCLKNYTTNKTNCVLNKTDVFKTPLDGTIYNVELVPISGLAAIVSFFNTTINSNRVDYCIDSTGTIRKADPASNLLLWSALSIDSVFADSYDIYDVVNVDGGTDNTYLLLRKTVSAVSEVHLYRFSYSTNLFTKVTSSSLPANVRHIGIKLTDGSNNYLTLTGIDDTVCIVNMSNFSVVVSKSITSDVVTNDGKLPSEKDSHVFFYTYNSTDKFFRLYLYGSLIYATLIFDGTALTTEYGNTNLGQAWQTLSSSSYMTVKDGLIYATTVTNNPDSQSTFYENKVFTTPVSAAMAGQCTGFTWSVLTTQLLDGPSEYAHTAIQRLVFDGNYFIGVLEAYENNINYTVGYVLSTNGTDFTFCRRTRQLSTTSVVKPAVKAGATIAFGSEAIKLISIASPIKLRLRYNSATAGQSDYSVPVTVTFK